MCCRLLDSGGYYIAKYRKPLGATGARQVATGYALGVRQAEKSSLRAVAFALALE